MGKSAICIFTAASLFAVASVQAGTSVEPWRFSEHNRTYAYNDKLLAQNNDLNAPMDVNGGYVDPNAPANANSDYVDPNASANINTQNTDPNQEAQSGNNRPKQQERSTRHGHSHSRPMIYTAWLANVSRALPRRLGRWQCQNNTCSLVTHAQPDNGTMLKLCAGLVQTAKRHGNLRIQVEKITDAQGQAIPGDYLRRCQK